jgi:dCMP deaminase
MKYCKRLHVTALGITKNLETYRSTNYNKSECSGEQGNCGCVHAEDSVLGNISPEIIIISHNPCLGCAKKLVDVGVKVVIYYKPYRTDEGVRYLLENNVKVVRME